MIQFISFVCTTYSSAPRTISSLVFHIASFASCIMRTTSFPLSLTVLVDAVALVRLWSASRCRPQVVRLRRSSAFICSMTGATKLNACRTPLRCNCARWWWVLPYAGDHRNSTEIDRNATEKRWENNTSTPRWLRRIPTALPAKSYQIRSDSCSPVRNKTGALTLLISSSVSTGCSALPEGSSSWMGSSRTWRNSAMFLVCCVM